MPGIAIHNFRGFKKTLIPLSQVNFFVGENSTGKTTVVSLIEILSSPRFYYSEELASEYCDFSSSCDVCDVFDLNAVSELFSIGYFRNAYTKQLGLIDSISFHFGNNDGAVVLKKVTYLCNGFLVNANFRHDKVLISICNAQIDLSSRPSHITAELMWGKKKNIEGSVVKKLVYKHSSLPMPSPLICAMNVLALESIKKDPSDQNIKTRLNPSPFRRPTWIAPIRAKAEPIHVKQALKFTPEGSHIPSIIRNAFSKKYIPELRTRLEKIVSAFGKESHLFDELNVKEYGNNQSSPFELLIKFKGIEYKSSNVGYGVSQALPVLIEIAFADNQDHFIIQQPEVHLHPRAQAAFGDFFFQMADERKHMLNIETHSDFLIDRFRLKLSKSKKRIKPSAQILFFSKGMNNTNVVARIEIKKDGSYPIELVREFKDFFIKEELQLLSI